MREEEETTQQLQLPLRITAHVLAVCHSYRLDMLDYLLDHRQNYGYIYIHRIKLHNQMDLMQ